MNPGAFVRRHWGWLLFDGALGIVVGIVALAWPGITLLALAVLLGAGLLVQGGVEFAAGVEAYSGTTGRGWTITFGLLAIAAGVICLASPATSLVVIAIGIAIWFFATGINEFMAATMLREHRVWNFAMGALDVLAGAIVAAQPGAGLSAAAFVTGLVFIVRGAGQVVLAFSLRSSPAAEAGAVAA